MGFRNGCYATVWSVDTSNDKVTRVRISTSRKPKGSDTYEQDFSGFVSLIGDANVTARNLNLQEKSRIKIVECEVTTRYDKVKEKEYVNYTAYKIEDGSFKDTNNAPIDARTDANPVEGDDDLPF